MPDQPESESSLRESLYVVNVIDPHSRERVSFTLYHREKKAKKAMMKGIVSIVLLGVTVNGCRFRGNSPGIQSVRGIARQAVGDVALHSHTIMKSGYEPEHSAEQFAAGCAEDIKKFNCPPVDTTKEGGIYTTFQCLRAFPITRSCMVAKRDW